ncbi:MAG: hypothetical protein SFU27_02410 [Thermonemataceae bacterium]|nr:hypothetical protein [Thermonemataceae bacterium]
MRIYKKSERSERFFCNFVNALLGEVSEAKRGHEPNKGCNPRNIGQKCRAKRGISAQRLQVGSVPQMHFFVRIA